MARNNLRPSSPGGSNFFAKNSYGHVALGQESLVEGLEGDDNGGGNKGKNPYKGFHGFTATKCQFLAPHSQTMPMSIMEVVPFQTLTFFPLAKVLQFMVVGRDLFAKTKVGPRPVLMPRVLMMGEGPF